MFACLAAAGCATDQSGSPVAVQQGLAELRLDAAALQAAMVTRVTVEAAGQTQDLAFNPSSGTYDGVLMLPSGPQTLVGRAFSSDMLVGVSNPVTVDLTPGDVTRVLLRILDLTTDTPVFGPVFDSLTFPTTVNAAASATFAISVLAPAHDPVTYQWSSDCADSAFTAPDAATTAWSKPSPGSCRIDVAAVSNGFSIAQSFVIVVFPEGTDGGAVNVNGVFVEHPTPQAGLQSNDRSCFAFAGISSNASCPITVAAPGTLRFGVNVPSWGQSTPGGITLSDDCGGHFAIDSQGSDGIVATWTPPTAGGLCILTGRAVNGDGIAGSVSIAALTRPGTLPRPAAVTGDLEQCHFEMLSGGVVLDCGAFSAGGVIGVRANVDWRDGTPGSLTVTDDCGGVRADFVPSFPFSTVWVLPPDRGRACHTTIDMVNRQGVESTATLAYRLF